MSTPSRLNRGANPLRSKPRDAEQGPTSPRQRGNGGQGRIMSKDVQSHFVAMTGEFVGTVLFLFFAFAATQTANNLATSPEPDVSQIMYISLAFGFSLGNTAWVFYRVSGGLFNPAVSKPSILSIDQAPNNLARKDCKSSCSMGLCLLSNRSPSV